MQNNSFQLFTTKILLKMEELLLNGKRIEIEYNPKKEQLKLGVCNYHRIKIDGGKKDDTGHGSK